MEVSILHLVEGARQARGITIVIDVFRAFSTACYAVDYGVRRIYPVGDIEMARGLKKRYPDFLLVGERNEQKPSDFDFGNSPALLDKEKLAGKNMIHTTSSGTQGIANAIHADEILTGSFVNAAALVHYIRNKQPDVVSLVCMGYACQRPTDEDSLCAEYLRNELLGFPSDFKAMKEQIRTGDGARFFDPKNQSWSPEADFELCLNLNCFDFVLKLNRENGLNFLERIDV